MKSLALILALSFATLIPLRVGSGVQTTVKTDHSERSERLLTTDEKRKEALVRVACTEALAGLEFDPEDPSKARTKVEFAQNSQEKALAIQSLELAGPSKIGEDRYEAQLVLKIWSSHGSFESTLQEESWPVFVEIARNAKKGSASVRKCGSLSAVPRTIPVDLAMVEDSER